MEITEQDGQPALDFAPRTHRANRLMREGRHEEALEAARVEESELRTRLASPAGILREFLKLGSLSPAALPRAAVRFARRYGPLQLDAFGVPIGQAVAEGRKPPRAANVELLERWQFYARVAAAVLSATRSLQRDEDVPAAAWEMIVAAWEERPGGSPWKRPGPAEEETSWFEPPSLPSGRFVRRRIPPPTRPPFLTDPVTGIVNWWIRVALMRPRLRWPRAGTVYSPGFELWEKSERQGQRYSRKRNLSDFRVVDGNKERPALLGSLGEPIALFGVDVEGDERPGFALAGGGAWGAIGVQLGEAIAWEGSENWGRCEWHPRGPHFFRTSDPRTTCCTRCRRARSAEQARKSRRKIGLETIDRLARTPKVQPGELLDAVHDGGRRR